MKIVENKNRKMPAAGTFLNLLLICKFPKLKFTKLKCPQFVQAPKFDWFSSQIYLKITSQIQGNGPKTSLKCKKKQLIGERMVFGQFLLGGRSILFFRKREASFWACPHNNCFLFAALYNSPNMTILMHPTWYNVPIF